MGRVAVVGHVEWMTFARVDVVPPVGGIAHATARWEGAGGGGGVAAVQLAKLARECELFTAFGDDEVGRRSAAELEANHVQVHAAIRSDPTREAVCLVDRDGERTITTLGPRLEAHADDPLPWESLAECDAVYVTAGDAEVLGRARAARVIVVSTRHLKPLIESGVRADAVVGSARDPHERYDPATLAHAPPGLVVLTEGADGGRFETADGERGRYESALLQGPISDTYGAGDSFHAGLTWALGEGLGIEEALAVAPPEVSSPRRISDDGHPRVVWGVGHSRRRGHRSRGTTFYHRVVNDIEASPPLPPVPPETPPEGTPARRRPRIEWIIGIGIVVLIAVVLVVLLRPRDRLPSELAGQPILHGALLDGLEEGMESFEYEGFSLDVAFYGRFALQPDYMVLVTNGPAPLDPTPGGSLFAELPTGVMSQDNAELDFSRAVRRTRDGVEFVCVPGERTDVGVSVSICFFQEDFAGMVIATNGTDPADLLDITMKLHEELG